MPAKVQPFFGSASQLPVVGHHAGAEVVDPGPPPLAVHVVEAGRPHALERHAHHDPGPAVEQHPTAQPHLALGAHLADLRRRGRRIPHGRGSLPGSRLPGQVLMRLARRHRLHPGFHLRLLLRAHLRLALRPAPTRAPPSRRRPTAPRHPLHTQLHYFSSSPSSFGKSVRAFLTLISYLWRARRLQYPLLPAKT